MSFTQKDKRNATEHCNGCDKKCTIGAISAGHTYHGILPAINGTAITEFYGTNNTKIESSRLIDAYNICYGLSPEVTANCLAHAVATMCDHYQKQR